MLYRSFPRTGTPVSAVSLGAEHLLQVDRPTCIDVVSAAIDHGMNYVDLFMSEAFVRDWIGEALRGRREKMLVAGHLGCTQKDGQYYRTRDVGMCREFMNDLLARLGTDYIDVLMMHFVDDLDDVKACLAPDGFLGLAQRYLKEGKARMLGFSSHSPIAAKALVETGLFDAMMFSLNPAMDLMPPEATLDDLFGEKLAAKTASAADFSPERLALYRMCEAAKTGIVVMQGYGAGHLLKQPGMTPEKAIHYALTRPGVVTMAAGCRSVAEVEAAARYCEAADGERDYTDFVRQARWNGAGACMYCNHCLPCPQGIDVAAVTPLLHRHEEGDAGAREEYRRLSANGGDCAACGDCAGRCPFGVDSAGNMARAHERMGK
jgi:predicted aldo/keto reductase-like oxidoreductase